jgi:hypothetical protein
MNILTEFKIADLVKKNVKLMNIVTVILLLQTNPGEKKIKTTIENCPKSTIANYKRLQI